MDVYYVGLKEICQRMGWKSVRTPINRMVNDGFPIFRNWIKPGNRFTVRQWMTCESFIKRWEMRLCERDRMEYIHRMENKRNPQNEEDGLPSGK